MSILVRFTGAPGMTAEKYDETLPRIEASGEFPPDGLEYHVAFSSGGSFRVSEIWDSMEQFEAFGQRLMPILTEGGVELRSTGGARDPQHHQAVAWRRADGSVDQSPSGDIPERWPRRRPTRQT